MQYSLLSNSELFQKTKMAAQNEKLATLTLLEYLAEVDRRKLYTEKAYSTLFEYVSSELGYSETQTADRVNAVRLMVAVPSVKEHLKTGELTLTTASQIQRFVRAESKAAQEAGERYSSAVTQEKKESVVISCLNQTKRQVERLLLSQMSESARVISEERIRPITKNRTELRFTVDESVAAKLEQLKNLVGNASLENIFEQALNLLIEQKAKKRGADVLTSGEKSGLDEKSKSTLPEKWNSKLHHLNASKPDTSEPDTSKPDTSETKIVNPYSRFIPIDWKRAIHARSGGQCEFMGDKNQIQPSSRRCISRYYLQIDHILPLAEGGKTELSNLRHLCAQHNRSEARRWGLEIDLKARGVVVKPKPKFQ